jgi:hypothetical protein
MEQAHLRQRIDRGVARALSAKRFLGHDVSTQGRVAALHCPFARTNADAPLRISRQRAKIALLLYTDAPNRAIFFMTFLPYLRHFFGSRTRPASSAALPVIHIGC